MAKNYENENKAKNYSTDKTSDKNAMDSRKQDFPFSCKEAGYVPASFAACR